jgi:hypothetical protein
LRKDKDYKTNKGRERKAIGKKGRHLSIPMGIK